MEAHEIIFLVLAAGGLLFGGAFWRKFDTAVKLLKELGGLLGRVAYLLKVTSDALKDRKVTKAEAVLLLKEWQEVSAQFKDVYDILVELLPASAIKFLLRN